MLFLDRVGVGGRDAPEDRGVATEFAFTEGVGIPGWGSLLTAEGASDGGKPAGGGRQGGQVSKGEVWGRHVYVGKCIGVDGV